MSLLKIHSASTFQFPRQEISWGSHQSTRKGRTLMRWRNQNRIKNCFESEMLRMSHDACSSIQHLENRRLTMSFVNIIRAIPLYSYTPVGEPWFVHTHGKSCSESCAAEPFCTGFSEVTLGDHCHLFYAPFCLFPYDIPESLDIRYELIEAKSVSEPAEWKDGQKIATIPAAKAVEIGSYRASISYTDATSAIITTSSGSAPWQLLDLSCADICSRASELLGFECAVALLQRDDQNSRPILCNLHDADNLPGKLEFSPNDDLYVNTEVVEMKGCERDDDADNQAETLKGRQSVLDSAPTPKLPKNSSFPKSKALLVVSFLSVVIMSNII